MGVISRAFIPFHVLLLLCEWPLKEVLDENANMGVQANYFVRKEPFSMGWNGGYGFKNPKKMKYRSLREKSTPFLHTGWPWWPFNALFVLCRSALFAATLANANLGQIRTNFARRSREFGPIFACGHAHLHHNKARPLCHEPSKRTMVAVCAVCGV